MDKQSQEQEHEHTSRNALRRVAGLLVVGALVLAACGAAANKGGEVVNSAVAAQTTAPIAIEAGHSSTDSGALSCDGQYKEATITDDIANRVAQKLRDAGYQVTVYRDNKGDFVGQTYQAYVALHVDYCPGGDVTGYKVARYAGAKGTGLQNNGDASDRLTQAIWDTYGAATGIPQDHSAGRYTDNFIYYFGLPGGSNGVSANTPGAIIELGWMQDPDLSILINRSDDVARGVADGIARFVGGN